MVRKKKKDKNDRYADDIVLIAEEEEVMKGMLEKFRGWGGKKG